MKEKIKELFYGTSQLLSIASNFTLKFELPKKNLKLAFFPLLGLLGNDVR